MTPDQLKNSILQLAIQGKLVEQRHEEGTAEELYKQIQAEKVELIKQGKLKKEKPLAPISPDEIPFEIPKNWFWTRLGQILIIARGGSPRPIKDFLTDSEDGINWIKIGDSDIGGKYINSTKEKIIPEGMKKSRFVHKGDFLLSNSMSFGRPYILNIDGCIHDGWLVLHPVKEIFDKDFLYYLLSSSMVFNQFCNRVAGAVVNNLNSDKAALTLVPLPPLAEQHRIVAKIEELLHLVEKYGKAYNKLEVLNKNFPAEIKKSILQYAIQGKLVEQRPEEGTAEELYKQIQTEKAELIKQGKIKKEKPLATISQDEIPFDIPETWKWTKIDDLFLVKSSKRVFEKDYVTSGIPFYRSKEIGELYRSESIKTELYITEDHYNELKEKYGIPQKGDILITSVGSIGNTWICDNRKFYYKDGNIIQICNNPNISSSFVEFFLHSSFFNKQIITTVAGTAYFALTIIKLKNIIFPLPPLAEQHRIVAKIEELFALVETLTKKV